MCFFHNVVEQMSSKKTEKKKFRSLKTSVAYLLIFLSIIFLFVFGGLNFYIHFNLQQSLISDHQALTAEKAAYLVDEFILDKGKELRITADMGNLLESDYDEQKLILAKLLSSDQAFRRILFFDENNSESIDVSRTTETIGYNYSKILSNFSDNSFNSSIMSDFIYLSQIYIDESSNEPLVLLAVPVTDVFDNFRGFLASEINLKFMWNLIDSLSLGENGIAFVIDEKGNLLAYRDISRVLAGENLVYLDEVNEIVNNERHQHQNNAEITRGIEGNLVVTTHYRLDTSDWAVVVELLLNEAYESVISGMIASSVTVIFTLTLALILGLYISRKVTNPIIDLRNAAISVGKGDLDTKIKIKENNEIGELTSSFNNMIDKLSWSRKKIEEYNKTLEKKVSDRTSQLTEKVEQLKHAEKKLKAAKKQIELFNRNLEKKVKERTSELSSANIRIKRLLAVKSQFLNQVAHDIRTPIYAISLSYELIRKNVSSKNKENMEIMGRNIIYLTNLVNDFLNIARIDDGKVDLVMKKQDIRKLIDDVIESNKRVFSEQNVKIEKNIPSDIPDVLIDENKIREVFSNIISNSVKYNDNSEKIIHISLSVSGRFLKVMITDNGIGLDKKDMKMLFTEFFKADPSRHQKGSSGLGLSICRRLIELHGGKIKAESKGIDKGLKITFTLPVNKK